MGYQADLDDLKRIWLDASRADDVDQRKVAIQIEYIISRIPFPDIQKQIQNDRKRLEKLYETEGDPDWSLRASFAAVTGVMKFIFEKFELVHEDIIGGATSRQYRDAILEAPDIPQEFIDNMPRGETQTKISAESTNT